MTWWSCLTANRKQQEFDSNVGTGSAFVPRASRFRESERGAGKQGGADLDAPAACCCDTLNLVMRRRFLVSIMLLQPQAASKPRR